MAEPLKNMYSRSYLEKFSGVFKDIYPAFDTKQFLKLVFDKEWESRELKQRMSHIALCLHKTLPGEYRKNISILKKAVRHFNGFLSMIFPDYAQQFGLNDPKTSVPALKLFTKYGSSEFAVRPFIIKYPEMLMPEMQKWARDKNHHVRRLASEGCRPRLPWAIALPVFKRDPAQVLKILEILKEDDSEYVRKSVANNLNDISKDNPQTALNTAVRWYGKNKKTDWIVKHGLRGLLKKGNPDALKMFGWHGAEGIEIERFKLSGIKVPVGGSFEFTFDIKPVNPLNENMRLEYSIDFITSTGKTSKKIFKITEARVEKGKVYSFKRKHSFKDLTTRKHFSGKHKISLIVNGKKTEEKVFYIT